jgi:hypothetical protein
VSAGGDGWISAARLKKQNGSSSDTRDRGKSERGDSTEQPGVARRGSGL